MSIRFTHTNIIAKDWRRLAAFYEVTLGCTPVYPERDLFGAWLDEATGVNDAHLSGIHLKLPGYDDKGPTLEIFQYEDMPAHTDTRINRPGLSHLAFAVDDVSETAGLIMQNGGSAVGKLTKVAVPGIGKITFWYLTDPEGNIIELQKWE